MAPVITVSVVTFNSSDEIERCVECVLAQSFESFELVIWDNASTDGTVERLTKLSHPKVTVLSSRENIGFCAAQNRIISKSQPEYILVLNPDCYLEKNYFEVVVSAARRDASIGAVAGKLYRLEETREAFATARKRERLDSTGIYFTPAFRHFDRGSDELERGRFNREEWVFGVTGAAALYRRAMLEAVQIDGEYFDADFFAYREDADLAWRMQSAGWKCLYTPHAVGYHVRKVLPKRRLQVAAPLNMHSVKNRFLFRLNNIAWPTAVRFFFPLLWRDLMVIGYVLLAEHPSLPGLFFVLRNFRRRWRRRKKVQAKRNIPLSSLHRWVRWRPAAFPVAGKNL